MVNQCRPTKFEISRFARYKAENGGAKCRKWGDLGWLGALKVNGNATIRQNAYDFYSSLIETMCLSFVVFEI